MMNELLKKILPNNNNNNNSSRIETNNKYEKISTIPTVTDSDENDHVIHVRKKRFNLYHLYRLIHFKMSLLYSIWWFMWIVLMIAHQQQEVQCVGVKPSYMSESNFNPYSTLNNNSPDRPQIASSSSSVFTTTTNQSSPISPTLLRTFARRSPQWSPNPLQYHYTTNHHVMSNVAREASSIVENITTAESTLRKDKRQILTVQQEIEPTQQQQVMEDVSKHYQCESIIQDGIFQIESPHYPAMYPVNRICPYYIARSRADVCQIEVNFLDMDIEDTPQCTADYLDLGGGQHERLCGMMLRNTKRIIMFPNNGSYIRITFHSDRQNNRPYRGFSAEIRQIPNSCFYPLNGLNNGTQQVIHSGYGQRLYPPIRTLGPYPPIPGQSNPPYLIPGSTYTPGFINGSLYPGNGSVPYYTKNGTGQFYPGSTFDQNGIRAIYPYNRTVNPQYPVNDPNFSRTGVNSFYPNGSIVPSYTGNRSGPFYPLNQTNISPIYLASYCDVYLSEVNGELRSPGYPFGYPPNHSCIYTIKKSFEDVCQLELIFHHFDIQTPDAKRDLTDICHGDYLELPDHSRLCGYYNQAMSRDHILKKFYLFPESSDYLFLQFISDQHQTPDGSGFWIETKQLRNTCVPGGLSPGRQDISNVKCDRLINGQLSTVDRVYSPNYPNYYSPRQQCVYFIQPTDGNTCEFELDLVQFQLEDVKSTNSIQEIGVCGKDFLQLPDRTRICGRAHFRRIFPFPKYHDRTAMFYFSSDEGVEDRGYEIVVRQLPNTCSNVTRNGQPTIPGMLNQNVYTVNDPNLRNYSPTPIFTYNNRTGIQPFNPQMMPTVVTQSNPNLSRKFPGFRKIGALGPSYSMVPNVLNDPRNVDSSGTIPLYFANGTLATRVPPMKPVDMIPFLKKGKTYAQKTDSLISGGNSNYLGIDGKTGTINSFNQPAILANTNNRLVIQPRSGLINSDSSFDPMRSVQLQPTYNCDQVLSRNVEYIRSPNFPSNYPPVTRCIYSILKADNSVCQVRLQILSMDMEYTQGCKNDYFQIETTGERMCGRFSQPETRTINYYGHSREIRLIFNSDRQITAPGFEVRLEQIPNSCEDIRSHNASLASMVSVARSFGPGNMETAHLPTTRSAKLINTSSNVEFITPQAAALITESPNKPECCHSKPATTIDSNMSNIGVFRANRNVCRLEIDLLDFDVGNELIDTSGNGLPLSSPTTTCPNDYLEVDQVKYCGRRRGHMIAVNFPRNLMEISFRFLAVSPDPFNGFKIRVRQIDENCRSSLNHFGSSSDPLGDFNPPIIESCPRMTEKPSESNQSDRSSSEPSTAAVAITEEVVRIQSPKFGLIGNMAYEPFLDCDYLIQKNSPSVCALEIKFESFSLEESRSCQKDYLEINHINGMRLCGKMPIDTTRTFDFNSKTIRLHFHTDADRNDSGFAIVLRQIRC
ncbi:hypothetical protein BLOT_005370 [Blomia tropicalis]|nr:hypothetical protein BLOT_005370 [Blomia tropicalis]